MKKTHEPITLLNGRNGDTLREWLKNNKNVKVVTEIGQVHMRK